MFSLLLVSGAVLQNAANVLIGLGRIRRSFAAKPPRSLQKTELHWHQQAEWAVMTYGNCRVTVLDQNGRPEVADVKEGDLWYFPAGLPHSLQGLDPDGCEFVIAFDNGDSSEFNTLLVTDWLAHTPPEVLAKNFGQPVEAFKNIPLHNKWIYQSNIAAPSLATVEAQIAAARPESDHSATS